MAVKVTKHALTRYRQRFDPKGAAAHVVALCARSKPVPEWVEKELQKRHPRMRFVSPTKCIASDSIILVVVDEYTGDSLAPNVVKVVTVLPLMFIDKAIAKRTRAEAKS